ncbi:hypothetical protein PAHAL_8G159400 [Panicum hallii]|uniref:Uncharacterized protein n=1 Tax=Panicum hallii TaxID=206008 RepID=A0A2T8I913_9POAL|nr:hypothetical protein PAHAL_8G159400 [Panicum hallii]
MKGEGERFIQDLRCAGGNPVPRHSFLPPMSRAASANLPCDKFFALSPPQFLSFSSAHIWKPLPILIFFLSNLSSAPFQSRLLPLPISDGSGVGASLAPRRAPMASKQKKGGSRNRPVNLESPPLPPSSMPPPSATPLAWPPQAAAPLPPYASWWPGSGAGNLGGQSTSMNPCK